MTEPENSPSFDEPPAADVPPSEIALDLPAHHFWRRNGITVGACVLAVVSLSIAIGVLATNSDGSTPSAQPAAPATTSAAPPTSAPPTSAPAGRKAAADKATRATILSESGPTWSVRTAKGATLTVTITAQTQFGTPKAPATAAQFPVGANVVITGTIANGGATATRVIAGPAAPPTSASASTSLTQS